MGSLSALNYGLGVNTIMTRSICPTCNQNFVAINRYVGDKVYYRKQCDTCLRKGKKIQTVPAWYKSGYRKKAVCEKCGYRAKFPEKQMSVYHVDGNLKNINQFNLKTVCLNCRVEIANSRLQWKESAITPDF
jgi:hypothetical protein